MISNQGNCCKTEPSHLCSHIVKGGSPCEECTGDPNQHSILIEYLSVCASEFNNLINAHRIFNQKKNEIAQKKIAELHLSNFTLQSKLREQELEKEKFEYLLQLKGTQHNNFRCYVIENHVNPLHPEHFLQIKVGDILIIKPFESVSDVVEAQFDPTVYKDKDLSRKLVDTKNIRYLDGPIPTTPINIYGIPQIKQGGNINKSPDIQLLGEDDDNTKSKKRKWVSEIPDDDSGVTKKMKFDNFRVNMCPNIGNCRDNYCRYAHHLSERRCFHYHNQHAGFSCRHGDNCLKKH